jgi:hypothetical protein
MGEDSGSILTSIPAARSCAAILSRSRTRKFTIQTFWVSPKYLLVSGKGAKTVGPASCSQTGSPSLDGVSETPRCCWYQTANAFGSRARKNSPPIPVTFSISVPPLDPCPAAAPAAGGEGTGSCAVCAANPACFRLQVKLEPKANDRILSSSRLGKRIPSSFREERELVHDTRAHRVLGSAKMLSRRSGRLSRLFVAGPAPGAGRRVLFSCSRRYGVRWLDTAFIRRGSTRPRGAAPLPAPSSRLPAPDIGDVNKSNSNFKSSPSRQPRRSPSLGCRRATPLRRNGTCGERSPAPDRAGRSAPGVYPDAFRRGAPIESAGPNHGPAEKSKAQAKATRSAKESSARSAVLRCVLIFIVSFSRHERSVRPISKAKPLGRETCSTFCSRGPGQRSACLP